MAIWARVHMAVIVAALLIVTSQGAPGGASAQAPAEKRAAFPSSFDFPGDYAGAVYPKTTTNTATMTGANIPIPNGSANYTDFNYVLLSAWDNAGSYDQIGISNYLGEWGLTYSTTTYCAGNYSFSADAYALTEGATYRFDMNLSANGNIHFHLKAVKDGIVGRQLWTYTTHTGGTHFSLSNHYSCDGQMYDGYTVYEEVYANWTGGAPTVAPPYNFSFVNIQANSVNVKGMLPYGTYPRPPITVAVVENGVYVDNDP